jgi:hypothetical protein
MVPFETIGLAQAVASSPYRQAYLVLWRQGSWTVRELPTDGASGAWPPETGHGSRVWLVTRSLSWPTRGRF